MTDRLTSFYRWMLRRRMRALDAECAWRETRVLNERIALEQAINARRDCSAQLGLLELSSFRPRIIDGQMRIAALAEMNHRPPRPVPPRSRPPARTPEIPPHETKG